VLRIASLLALLGLAMACSHGPQETPFACAYPAAASAANPEPEVVGYKDCGFYDREGNPVFSAEQEQGLRAAARDKLICVYTGSEQGHYRVFYVYNERRLETVFYDNGCDYFSEGLVRVFDKDTTAFADAQLNIVIRPGTVLATPFHAGHAVVCNGPFSYDKVDEHVRQTSGHCGLIDHQGTLVVPMAYEREAEVFEQYIIAHNGCIPPPISDPQQALCHALWQARLNEFLPEGEFTNKVSSSDGQWQVLLYPKRSREQLLIELRRDSAGLIIIQRQPLGQKGSAM